MNSTILSTIWLVLFMVLAGAAGGFTNYLLSAKTDPPSLPKVDGATPLPWCGYIFIGIVATFIVPLFLSLAGSTILDNLFKTDPGAVPYTESVFVFVGFCLVASVSSRAFLQTISDRVLALAKQTAKQSEETKKKTEALDTTVGELEANMAPPDAVGQKSETVAYVAPGPPPKITDDEAQVLKALQAKTYRRRTLNGVSNDSTFERNKTLQLLGGLINKGLAREIASQKTNNLLYEITALGASAIA